MKFALRNLVPGGPFTYSTPINQDYYMETIPSLTELRILLAKAPLQNFLRSSLFQNQISTGYLKSNNFGIRNSPRSEPWPGEKSNCEIDARGFDQRAHSLKATSTLILKSIKFGL